MATTGIKSDLKKVEKTIELDGSGKNRIEAISDAFSKMRKSLYQCVDGLVVDTHAIDVFILEEKEETKIKKFLGWFLPKEIKSYQVKLKVVCEIKYL